MTSDGHAHGEAGSSGASFEVVSLASVTNVDIVAVPAIGADPRETWTADGSQDPWLIEELKEYITAARVLLFDHGEPGDDDSLETLADRFLKRLHDARQAGTSRRPIFFICHSTGGLVAKAALVLASRSASSLSTILTSCHGIGFLATPHQGSTYLSAEEYADSIQHLMQLKSEIPYRVRDSLRPRHHYLQQLSNQFKSISADMKVWTFLETLDSTINITDMDTGNTVEFHIPITSIRSGLLNLEHEKEIPLATDHVGIAYFKDQKATQTSFLIELKLAVQTAVKLSAVEDIAPSVEDMVSVYVHGFFEDTARGVSQETPLKLWSSKASLKEFLEKGPAECLRDRLKKTNKMPPEPYDYRSSTGVRRRRPLVNAMLGHGRHQGETTESPNSSLDDVLPPKPSMKQSRSSVVPASPRIHITEPDVDNYFEYQSEDMKTLVQRPQRRNRSGRISDLRLDNVDNSNEQTQGEFGEANKTSRSQLLLPPDGSARSPINRFRHTPRFDRPEPDSEKLLWIHVPYTHTGWVPQVLSKACTDTERSKFLSVFLSDENWFLKHSRARHLEPHARYVKPTCIHATQPDASPNNRLNAMKDSQLALYFPYLHWDTYRNLLQRRKVVEQRLLQGRARPVPEEILKASLEAQLIWAYLGCEPPIHFRRTLDQFGYPNLRSTLARDDDQMLWKRTRKEPNLDAKFYGLDMNQDSGRSALPFRDGKVIMVDQLWLWVVNHKTVVTFFPNQEATTSEGKLYEQSNLHSSLYNELNGDLARRFETAGDLAALIVLHAVTVLLERTLHRDLQVLRIFEESISILTESVTKSFKRFRSRGFINRPADHNKRADGTPMTSAERDQRDVEIANQNREDLSALLELRDIIDELGTILKLLDQQEATIKSMVSYYEGKGYGKVFLEVALKSIEEYRTQVTEMKDNAHLAQKAVENLLDLKQKQANVDEARMARWEAEVTQDQSRSVMVFTIFTVIFLPLSFFTSLFGINAREWSGTRQNLTLRTMLIIAGPVSIAIILIALLLAFSEHLREVASKARKIIVGLILDFILRPIHRALQLKRIPKKLPKVGASDKSVLKNRLDRYLGYRGHRKQTDYDIWKRHEDRVMSPLPPVSEWEKEIVESVNEARRGGRLGREGDPAV